MQEREEKRNKWEEAQKYLCQTRAERMIPNDTRMMDDVRIRDREGWAGH